MSIDAMKERTGNIMFYAVAAVAIAVGVHLAQEYRFYNIAANDLFLYDWSHLWNELGQVGGFATLVASFLTQFMHLPFVGTVIVTALYVLMGWLFSRILSKQAGRPVMKAMAFLPVVWLFLCMDNDYYRFQGHLAYLMALAALYIYVSFPAGWLKYRHIAGLVLTLALYHLAGSAAVLFVLCLLSWEIIRYGIRGLTALIYPAVLFLMAWLYVRLSAADSWKHALTPYMYYDWPSTFSFPLTAWLMTLLMMWVTRMLMLKEKLMSSSLWISACAFVACLVIAATLYGQVHSRSYYRLIQEQHWASKGEWEKIIETADRRQPNFLISYLNLALAHEEKLVDRLGYYNPQPVSKVMFPTHNLKTGLTLQSTVYSAWGYTAAARQAAFDANMVTPGMRNPQQLKTLVLTNIALGAPEVAKKYLTVLEKTLFHRGWARQMQAYVEDSALISEHEQLSRLCRTLPQTEGYVRYEGLKGDMRDALAADPSNGILSQFHTAYLMLETLEER